MRVEDYDKNLVISSELPICTDVVRMTYENAIAARDKNGVFFDGATLFKGDFFDCCTVGGAHPTDLGFYGMVKAIEMRWRGF